MYDITQNSRIWRCHCMSGNCNAVPLGSMTALHRVLGEKLRLLAGGIEPLDTIAPGFSSVGSLTVGPNSLFNVRGRVAPLQFPGEPFSCPPGEINIRVGHQKVPVRETCLVAVSPPVPEHGRPMALHVFDEDGGLVQRMDAVERDDALLLVAATSSHPLWDGSVDGCGIGRQGPQREDNVVALMPKFAPGKNWKLMPLAEHLDHIISDGGRQRYKRLKSLGTEEVRSIDPNVLPHLLDILAAMRRPFVRIFFRKTIAQAHQGPVHLSNVTNDILLAYSRNTVSALDLQSIGRAWLVPYAAKVGISTCLEIYDRSGACLAMFLSELPDVCMEQIDWDELMFSLPGHA